MLTELNNAFQIKIKKFWVVHIYLTWNKRLLIPMNHHQNNFLKLNWTFKKRRNISLLDNLVISFCIIFIRIRLLYNFRCMKLLSVLYICNTSLRIMFLWAIFFANLIFVRCSFGFAILLNRFELFRARLMRRNQNISNWILCTILHTPSSNYQLFFYSLRIQVHYFHILLQFRLFCQKINPRGFRNISLLKSDFRLEFIILLILLL